MRWYTIKMTPPKTGKTISGLPLTYTSLNNLGYPNPGALEISFDIVNAEGHNIGPSAHLRIHNVPLSICQICRNYQGMKIEISAGFLNNGTSGFKLARQWQSGVIAFGYIQACIPNYMGTEMVLDFIIIPTATGSPYVGSPEYFAQNSPKPYVFNWTKGQDFREAIVKTFKTLGLKVNGTVSSKVKNNTNVTISNVCSNFTTFCEYINEKTQNLVDPPVQGKNQTYDGVSIVYTAIDTVTIFDNTYGGGIVNLYADEFIGQPSVFTPRGLEVQSIHPLRSDVFLPAYVQFPNITTLISPSVGAVAGAQQKPLTSANTKLKVKQVRHLGRFRDPTAQGWATYITSASIIGQ